LLAALLAVGGVAHGQQVGAGRCRAGVAPRRSRAIVPAISPRARKMLFAPLASSDPRCRSFGWAQCNSTAAADREGTAPTSSMPPRPARAKAHTGLALVYCPKAWRGHAARREAGGRTSSRRLRRPGHVRSQNQPRNSLYARARGVPADLIQGARLAGEGRPAGGDPQALYTLGPRLVRQRGTGCRPTPVRAADLYRRAAEKRQMLSAGLRYGLALSGRQTAVKRGPRSRPALADAGAGKSGIAEAALRPGRHGRARTPATREQGKPTRRSSQSALSWYQGAANAGVPSAQFKLAQTPTSPASACPRESPRRRCSGTTVAAQQGLPAGPARGRHPWLIGRRGRRARIRSRATKWLLLAEKGGHPGFPRRFGKRRRSKLPNQNRKKARRGAGAALRADIRGVRANDGSTSGRAKSAEDSVQPLDPAYEHAVRHANRRAPEVTLAVCRGACRLMRQGRPFRLLLEVPLPGRQGGADIFLPWAAAARSPSSR